MVNLPHKLIAGETLSARVCHASATSVTAIVVGPSKFSLGFEQAGEEWKLSQATDAWPAGLYQWQVWIETADGKSVGDSGRITIEASLVNVEAGADPRTTAEKNIEALEAMLSGKATNAVKRYRINNRELENYSLTELTALLDYWKGVRHRARRKRRRIGPNLRAAL